MNDTETLARIIGGEASADEIARFAEAAKSDPQLLEAYVRHREIDAALSVIHEDPARKEWIRERFLSAVGEAERDLFKRGVTRRLESRRRFMTISRIAATLALVCGGTLLWTKPWPHDVATITRLEGVEWDGKPAGAAGDDLRKGSVLSISDGLVELEMDGRGKMILEGPARLTLDNAHAATLDRGRLSMHVTRKGHGYRIGTPEGDVVDLGTEFGISVGSDGESEIHVIEGKVEVMPNGGSNEYLARDEAMRLGGGGSRIQADRTGFYTALPPRAESTANYVHWSFDEPSGPAMATERGLTPGPKEMTLHFMDQGAMPRREPAAFGSGLAFDGKGSYSESAFRGIDGNKPRTVCFWVKAPEDLGPRESSALVSWGRFQHDRYGEAWQIAINSIPQDGEDGRIRVGAVGGTIVGTQDLRDGKWHHVAVVLYGGSHQNIGTHVIIYIDGKMERISRRALGQIMTNTQSADHGVWLGRNISYLRTTPDHWYGGFFRGVLDEVYIFDTALPAEEILRLMETNIPPQ